MASNTDHTPTAFQLAMAEITGICVAEQEAMSINEWFRRCAPYDAQAAAMAAGKDPA